MKTDFKKIIDLYEDLGVISGKFDSAHQKIMYSAPSSLHSHVTTFAYGIVEDKECVDVSTVPLKVIFDLDKRQLEEKRFLLQISSCLDNWEKFINDIKITINGKLIFQSQREFFENVCLGWPVKYHEIKNELLVEGQNVCEISTSNSSGAGLYVQFVNLITRPIIKDCTQISCLRYVRCGDKFSIAVSNSGLKDISVVSTNNCQILNIEALYKSKDRSVLTLVANQIGQAQCKISIGGKNLDLLLPEIVKASDDRCALGFDSDDHMHYLCNEFERIPDYMMMEGLGSYLQFRPQAERNFIDLAPIENWEIILKRLVQFGIKVNLCDQNNHLGFIKQIIPDNYAGKHVHEPYLFFRKELATHPRYSKEYHIDVNRILSTNIFEESKQMYLKALEQTRSEYSTGESFSVGSPSLLCCYEATVFDRVTMEPVSGINLELGGVRASAKATWGAHIPIEWYYGSPNDQTKSRKFICSLLYCYMNGASYMYAENAIFKTNSFSREEFNTKFCLDNRRYLREFYDYTVANPREGQIVVDLAIVYGNNEYFMWRDDQRLAEIGEHGDWDKEIWGKWPEKGQHKYWRAVDAWLPFAQDQNTNDEITNLDLYSGTPYGNVDVLPYSSDFNKYKAIVFLGWNTYEKGLDEKLSSFVANGGTAYISYRHFNMTDTTDLPFKYASSDSIWALLGVEGERTINSQGNILFSDGRCVETDSSESILNCVATSASVLAKDQDGNGIVFCNNYGKGKIYFSTVASYYTNDWVISVDKLVMTEIAKATARVTCDNNNVAFVERVLDNGSRKIQALGMNTNSEEKISFSVSYKIQGVVKTKSGKVNSTQIIEIDLD